MKFVTIALFIVASAMSVNAQNIQIKCEDGKPCPITKPQACECPKCPTKPEPCPIPAPCPKPEPCPIPEKATCPNE